MKKIFLLSFFMMFSAMSIAHDHGNKSMADSIVIEKVWARETFKMAKSGAAYVTLGNPTEKDIQLVSASVDESVAGMVQIHHTKLIDGMMRMQELEDGVTIKAGETATFQPGGTHFMIMGLTGPFVGNTSFDITLTFADGSEQVASVDIQDMRTATE